MESETKKTGFKPTQIITSILCVVLGLILLSNIIVIVKGSLNPDRPPSVFGFTSMIVMSGSMSGTAPDHIEIGDLIITKPAEALQVGDIITFLENGRTAVTHRIIAINEDGSFQTQGDANNGPDVQPVQPENVIGKFWFRVPKLGEVAMFAQTPKGMLIFIAVPLAIYLGLDVVVRFLQNKKDNQQAGDTQAEKVRLEQELAELKAKLAEAEQKNE